MAAHDLLRHTLATLAYRGGKAVRNAPEAFPDFRVGATTRTPAEILAHIGDLLDWALSIARGQQAWRDASPRAWEREVERFHAALTTFDEYIASGEPLNATAEKLFQGPIADALTHVGQLTVARLSKRRIISSLILRRVAWAQTNPIPNESSTDRRRALVLTQSD